MNPGLVGGIVGSAVGILGGLAGTWMSIRSCRTAVERAFMIWVSVAIWLLVGALLTGLMLLPPPYNWLLWIPYPFVLFAFITWTNRRLARLRETPNDPPTMGTDSEQVSL